MAAKKRKKGFLRSALLMFFIVAAPLSVGLAGGAYLAFARTVPSVAELKEHRVPPSTKVYADDDALIGEIKVEKGVHVPLGKMPRRLIDAVVAVEDSNFWKHRGIDYLAIVRAAATDILERQLKEGASTITQQLAKMTFLTPEKTIRRKIKEAVLATRIERELSKEEILEIYLNRAYFGHGAYGVEMAARTYFKKPVEELSLEESALLAGLLKAPSNYSPFKSIEKAKARQQIVLERMEEEGFINRKEKTEAAAAPIYLSAVMSGKEVNYFIDYVRRHLEDKYGTEEVYGGGMKVYTTLDRRAQLAAQEAVKRGLREADKRRGFRGPIEHRDVDVEKEIKGGGSFRSIVPDAGAVVPGVVLKVKRDEAVIKAAGVVGKLLGADAEWAKKTYDEKTGKAKSVEKFSLDKILKPGDVVMVGVKSASGREAAFALEQEPEVQGALVALERETGFIRALVGGYDYTRSEFNRAILAKRQPGSSFKPVVFSVALSNGFTPASVVEDEFVAYQRRAGGVADPGEPGYDPKDFWIPKNYDGEYYGPTRLRDALAYSRNVVSVKLVEKVGVQKMIEAAHAVGIRGELQRDLTLGLGTMSVTPLEMTAAYGVFANGGMRTEPIGIKYIVNRQGKVIESNEPHGERVMDEQTAYLMTSMMEDVVNYGTGQKAKALGRPVAGKTGTTNDYRDAWFLGYTMDMVAGAWVGFDDMRPLGKDETGSRAALPIWVDFMQSVSSGMEPRDFPVPPGITTRLIDKKSGLLANRWTDAPLLECFKEGTEPREEAPSIWQTTEPDSLIISP